MSFYKWGRGLGRVANCPAGYRCPRTGQFLYGALIGVSVTAAGYYLYKKNQEKIDDKLRKHGINIKSSCGNNFKELSLDELLEKKELLEEAIAEK